MKNWVIYLFCILVGMSCVQGNVNNCSKRGFIYLNEKFEAQGCFKNGKEDGEWELTNEGKLIESGRFIDGIRIGKWIYPKQLSDSIIEWRKFIKSDKDLIFNIPKGLQIAKEDSDYVKFSNMDTSNLFNFFVSVHDISEIPGGVNAYYKQGEKEIMIMNWSFEVLNEAKLLTQSRDVYFREYIIRDQNNKAFKMLNAFGIMKDKKLLELGCRYNEDVETSARTIFFSVFTNIFYKNERFTNPFENFVQK